MGKLKPRGAGGLLSQSTLTHPPRGIAGHEMIEALPRPIQPSHNVCSVLWTPNGRPQFEPDIIKELPQTS